MEAQDSSTPRKTASLMISYSRKDRVFVKQLYDSLVGQGFLPEDIWVDWEGIPLSADWMVEITKGIQSANAFIFVISPDSAASDVCKKEIEIAAESNKRFIPILHREPGKETKIHEKISSHNWVFIRDEQELEKTLPALVEAINTDLDWLAQHTRLFNRAKEWEGKGRNDSYLVRGNDLQDAETFIGQGAAGKEPAPTPLHVEYVQAARKHAASLRRRNRIIAAVVGVALLVLSIFALIQWGIAEAETVRANDNANTAVAEQVRADNNAATAVANEQVAKENEAIAQTVARVANALALASEAINQRNSDTQLSLMLALLSIQETDADGFVLDESKSAVFSSLNSPNVLHTWFNDDVIVWETAYDPTGAYAAFGDDNGVVRIVDVESRETVHTLIPFNDESSISGLDFSPDGRRLGVSSSNGTAKVVDVNTGDELFAIAGHPDGWINDLDFSPDGRWIATAGDDNLVKLWYADTGTLKVSLPSHTSFVNSVDFGPGGARLVSGSDDGTAIVWDVETSSLLFKLRPEGFQSGTSVRSVAFSQDGTRVLTGGYKTVVVWNAENGLELQRLNGNRATIYDVDFAPDNLGMVTVSAGIKIWDWVYGTERFNLSAHHGEVNSLTFNADGDRMVTGSWDSSAKLWAANLRIETLRLKQHNAPNTDANYSSDGKWIATADNNGVVLVHNASTGEVVDQFSGYSASFDPQDSNRVLTVHNSNILIWVLGQEEPALTIGNQDTFFTSAVFGPDGGTLLSEGNDIVNIWDSRTGASLAQFGFNGYKPRFSPDGQRIAILSGNFTSILDAKSGDKLMDLVGHTDQVLIVIFSRDGRYVYTGGYDNTIRKWDAGTGRQLQVMTGHTGRIFDLDVSPDDSLVASASADTTVRVWNAETGKEIYKYEGNNEDANSVAFSPDGTKVLTASADKTSREFTIDYETLLQIAQDYELEPLTTEECQRYLYRDDCSLSLFGYVVSASEPTTAEEAQPANEVVTLVFTNNTTSDVEVYWVDFEGKEQLYLAIPAGETARQETFPTHVWRVRDPDGNLLLEYAATDESTQTVDIQPVESSGEVPPSQAPASQPLYTEEFDADLGASWVRFMVTGSENQVNARTDGGSLFVQLSPDAEKIPRFYLVNTSSDYSVVQLEAATANYGNNANGVSLVCHYNGENWYEFTVSNAGLYSISAYGPAAAALQGYVQLAGGGSGAIKSGQASNTYRAVCNGNELTLYVNDTLVKTLVDAKYNLKGGMIGIGVSSPQMLPVEVSFESLTISEP